MLKHYLEKISALEFGERNEKIPELVLKEKNAMNARGVLPSTMTLKAVASVFEDEFLLRCDFLLEFVASHPNLLALESEGDILTVAKTLFQNSVFSERDKLKSLYSSSISTIAGSLQNETMKSEIESRLIGLMERRINKNNLYLEIAFREAMAEKPEKNSFIMFRPNINGIGVDFNELWSRYLG